MYDENLVKSIILHCLNNSSRIIKVLTTGGKATIWIYSKFGIAEGTVPLFTSREMHGFPNVIGELDGSHMNLFDAPSKLNKEVYFSRKRRQAIHLQAVEADYVLADTAYIISSNIIPSFKISQS
ncbi:hypothetical protein C2G38_2189253 [Gigaspora rosea]|uniref:DDE Tnp4 domain-containing protein n=1 Tax=Gigaspora rosea TaxID=44941 RepID=A0A397V2E8_9GLOM|nr:hypothetical protein C2G38_2189253 [Gigaspora rosea]